MTVRILTGDVRERLADLPDGSVQCVVTSPPYFGLRDYGTAQWDGGDPECDHKRVAGVASSVRTSTLVGSKDTVGHQHESVGKHCPRCGAVRIDNQIGLEPTLAEYVQTMVDVFREVRRVLRDDGCVFLNLGDSYNGSSVRTNDGFNERSGNAPGLRKQENGRDVPVRNVSGLKPKDLMMVPARVALALQDDGWWLRSDIIWAKKNCMPESVTDRPTSSHEHIFLLTKQARYFYDAEAVREDSQPSSIERVKTGWNGNQERGYVNGPQNHLSQFMGTERAIELAAAGRNQRNVWHLATEPFPEAHFATFPTEIPRRAIRAGTSEKGQCPACGAPWQRVVERETNWQERKQNGAWAGNVGVAENYQNNVHGKGMSHDLYSNSQTTGWSPSCTCNAGEPVPQTVLDPFMGAGTTLLVADQLGRHGVGIELNAAYAEMARQRIYNDAPMFAELVAD